MSRFTTSFAWTACMLFQLAGVAAQDMLNCGTPAVLSPWLRRHQATPQAFRHGGDTILWLPHTVHLTGEDDSTGYFPSSKVVEALCTLNGDYAASNIQFYLTAGFHYIPNSAWNQHDHVLDGYEMMAVHDVPATVNSYIVQDPAGYCGYNLPYGSMTVNRSCADAGDHTWAHEAGHFFSLPHPFFGWETLDYDYNAPTPFTVTSDAYTFFQDTVVWDTSASILETRYVEWMDYGNCDTAADLFCDTRPDYLSYRWPCGNDQFSLAPQKDPYGVEFHSDGTLIMSYSYDECKTRFSEEQISAMRANIFDEYPELLTGYQPLPLIENTVSVPVTPLPEDIVDPSEAFLSWTPTPHATHYIVQLTRFSSFSVVEIELLVEGTSVVVNGLLANKTYRWRVKAFNANSYCGTYTGIFLFDTGETATSLPGTYSSIVRVFPNLVTAGQSVIVQSDAEEIAEGTMVLWDIQGRKAAVPVSFERHRAVVQTTGSIPGMHLLQWKGLETGDSYTAKIAVY